MEEDVILIEEELTQLQKFQSGINVSIQEFGELTYQSKMIAQRLEEVESQLDLDIGQRNSFLKNLERKYGLGSIDLVTGQFTKQNPPT